MKTKHRFELYRVGELVTKQSKLNQAIPFLNEIAPLLPPRETADPGNSEDEGADELWKFIDSETETVRIVDDDDANTYVDVEVTNSITVELPDGRRVQIQLRIPSSG